MARHGITVREYVLLTAQQDLKKALSGELQGPTPIDEIVETVGQKIRSSDSSTVPRSTVHR